MRNVYMYLYAIGFLLAFIVLKFYRHYKRMPGCILLVYVAVLVTDLVVGCSIIVWKCSISKAEEECDLAFGGTIGSLVIWLIIMFVCPCFATRCEICITLENVRQKCAQYMEKLRPKQSRDVSIKDVVYRPTAPLLHKGQGHFTIIDGDAVRRSENGFYSNHIPQVHICNERTEARNNGSHVKYLQSDDP